MVVADAAVEQNAYSVLRDQYDQLQAGTANVNNATHRRHTYTAP